MVTIDIVLTQILSLRKAGPPGPPPRPGLEWKEETRRWIRPKDKTVPKSSKIQPKEKIERKPKEWEPKIKAIEGAPQLQVDTTKLEGKAVMAGIKPEFREQLTMLLKSRPITVHSKASWDKYIEKLADNIPIMPIADTIQGLYTPKGATRGKGIHISYQAHQKLPGTTVHEVGHLIMDYELGGGDLYKNMSSNYFKLKDESREDQNKTVTVSSYSLRSSFEYFAEAFRAFFTDRAALKVVDEEAYRLLTKYLVEEDAETIDLTKAPPGPKPKRFGPDVDWDDKRHRWVSGASAVTTEESVKEDDASAGGKPKQVRPTKLQRLRDKETPSIGDITEFAGDVVPASRGDGAMDMQLRDFAEFRWGRQQAQIVSGEEFDTVESRYPVLARGIGNVEHLESNLNGSWMGTGAGVNGQYYGARGSMVAAMDYGSLDRGGWIHTAKLNPEARVITRTGLSKLDRPWRNKGMNAVYHGFDAVYNEDNGLMVVLNRRALVVDGRSLPGGEFEQAARKKVPDPHTPQQRSDVIKYAERIFSETLDLANRVREGKASDEEIAALDMATNTMKKLQSSVEAIPPVQMAWMETAAQQYGDEELSKAVEWYKKQPKRLE